MNSKTGLILLAVVGAALGGFAAGYVAGRDPEALRRWARTLAGGLERAKYAVAESTESIADLWSEVQGVARQEVEAAAFAAAGAAAASAVTPAAEPSPAASPRRRARGATSAPKRSATTQRATRSSTRKRTPAQREA